MVRNISDIHKSCNDKIMTVEVRGNYFDAILSEIICNYPLQVKPKLHAGL